MGLPPLNSEEQVLADRIREAVLAELDGRIKVTMDEVFQKGKDMMNKMQQSTNQRVTELQKELMQCREKVNMLEAANLKLVQGRAQLEGCMDFAESFAAASPLRPAHESPCYFQSPLWRPPPGMQELASTERDPLGDIPPFPAAAAIGSPPQLSLVEALKSPAQRTQLSLAESLRAPGSTDTCSAANSDARAKVVEFSFTIRKADGMELGLNISHQDGEQMLRVEGVRPDGAVEAWNRQCFGHAADKAVRVGDKIVSVNTVSKDPAKMLEECRNKHLLKLSVLRTVEAESSGTSSLRAGASVFVPMLPNNPQADA
jgi:hypothetical protein